MSDRTKTLDDRIMALLDVEDIRALRVRYSHALDGHDIAGLDDVFAADATVEVTVGVMKGLEEIQKGLSEAYDLFDRDRRGNYPFLHAITNHTITFTGPDSASGRCYLIDFETATKADPNPLLLLGLYNDEYQRIDGAWRITRSRLETVWPTRN